MLQSTRSWLAVILLIMMCTGSAFGKDSSARERTRHGVAVELLGDVPCLHDPHFLRASHHVPGRIYGMCHTPRNEDSMGFNNLIFWIDADSPSQVKTANISTLHQTTNSYSNLIEVGPDHYVQSFAQAEVYNNAPSQDGLFSVDVASMTAAHHPFTAIDIPESAASYLIPENVRGMTYSPSLHALFIGTSNFIAEDTATGEVTFLPSTILQFAITKQFEPVLVRHRTSAPHIDQLWVTNAPGQEMLVALYRNSETKETKLGVMNAWYKLTTAHVPAPVTAKTTPVFTTGPTVTDPMVGQLGELQATMIPGPAGIIVFTNNHTVMHSQTLARQFHSGHAAAFVTYVNTLLPATELKYESGFAESFGFKSQGFDPGPMASVYSDGEQRTFIAHKYFPFIRKLDVLTHKPKQSSGSPWQYPDTGATLYAYNPSCDTALTMPALQTAVQSGAETDPYCPITITAMAANEQHLYFVRGNQLLRFAH